MIKNSPELKEFEKNYVKNPPDFFQNMKIYEALFYEACELGIFPLKDPLEGIDEKIKLAKKLNVL